MSYFQQTKTGESRWWSWIVVTWFAFLGWVVFQVVLTAPIIEVLKPVFSGIIQSKQAATLSKISLLFGSLATGTALMCLVTRDHVRNVSAGLVGFSVAAYFLTSNLASKDIDKSEVVSAFNQIIGSSPLYYLLILLTYPAGLIALYFAKLRFIIAL